jgi:hypothetical protein
MSIQDSLQSPSGFLSRDTQPSTNLPKSQGSCSRLSDVMNFLKTQSSKVNNQFQQAMKGVLNCFGFTDKRLAMYTRIFPKTQTLSLRSCHAVTSKGLQKLRDCKDLRELDLYHTDTNDEVLQSIAPLPLRKLDVAYCYDITEKGIKALAEQCKSLEYLSLATHGGLKGKIGEHLAKLPKLRELNLSGCYGIEAADLSKLVACKNLVKLTLSYTRVNNKVIKDLMPLLSNLEEFHIEGGVEGYKISDEVVQQIRSSCRKLKKFTPPGTSTGRIRLADEVKEAKQN